MSKVWVQAVTNYNLNDGGRMSQKFPGDWFQLGKHDARNAQVAGQIIIHNPVYRNAIIPAESGIVLRQKIAFAYGALPVSYEMNPLPHQKTMIWDQSFNLDINLIPVGLNLLDRWEIAVPISDYNLLARDIGTDKEREETGSIIHDLRVPAYDTRLIFARECTATSRLIDMWQNETGDERLAFLRCLYAVKPYVLALPSVWLRS